MKRIFIDYYLVSFIGFFILFILQGLFGKSVNSIQENIFIAFVFAAILTLIVGTLYYFIDIKWGPKKRTKSMSRSPFKELKEHGFQEHEDFVWGFVNDYTVLVFYDWTTGRSAVNIEVLFHPKSFGQFVSLQELRQLKKKHAIKNFWYHKEYSWGRNTLGYPMEYNFKPPSFEKVLSKARELTDILSMEHLKPITKEEAEKVLPELRAWIDANKGEQGIV